nr:hypothetical protein [Tanacetum cinerariifolium]
QYSIRARIAQSSALPTIADEPASPVRDVNEREACPTESGFIADQDRATIITSSTLPHDSAPRVTSSATDEGSMQHNISKLMALCTNLQRQYSELQAKFQAQEEEIVKLKDRVNVLEDREVKLDPLLVQLLQEEKARKPMTKKQKRKYYMAVIKSNLRWRIKDFKGMTFEEIEAKFAEVWKQVKDFIPMGSKEETERLKR